MAASSSTALTTHSLSSKDLQFRLKSAALLTENSFRLLLEFPHDDEAPDKAAISQNLENIKMHVNQAQQLMNKYVSKYQEEIGEDTKSEAEIERLTNKKLSSFPSYQKLKIFCDLWDMRYVTDQKTLESLQSPELRYLAPLYSMVEVCNSNYQLMGMIIAAVLGNDLAIRELLKMKLPPGDDLPLQEELVEKMLMIYLTRYVRVDDTPSAKEWTKADIENERSFLKQVIDHFSNKLLDVHFFARIVLASINLLSGDKWAILELVNIIEDLENKIIKTSPYPFLQAVFQDKNKGFGEVYKWGSLQLQSLAIHFFLCNIMPYLDSSSHALNKEYTLNNISRLMRNTVGSPAMSSFNLLHPSDFLEKQLCKQILFLPMLDLSDSKKEYVSKGMPAVLACWIIMEGKVPSIRNQLQHSVNLSFMQPTEKDIQRLKIAMNFLNKMMVGVGVSNHWILTKEGRKCKNHAFGLFYQVRDDFKKRLALFTKNEARIRSVAAECLEYFSEDYRKIDKFIYLDELSQSSQFRMHDRILTELREGGDLTFLSPLLTLFEANKSNDKASGFLFSSFLGHTGSSSKVDLTRTILTNPDLTPRLATQATLPHSDEKNEVSKKHHKKKISSRPTEIYTPLPSLQPALAPSGVSHFDETSSSPLPKIITMEEQQSVDELLRLLVEVQMKMAELTKLLKYPASPEKFRYQLTACQIQLKMKVPNHAELIALYKQELCIKEIRKICRLRKKESGTLELLHRLNKQLDISLSEHEEWQRVQKQEKIKMKESSIAKPSKYLDPKSTALTSFHQHWHEKENAAIHSVSSSGPIVESKWEPELRYKVSELKISSFVTSHMENLYKNLVADILSNILAFEPTGNHLLVAMKIDAFSAVIMALDAALQLFKVRDYSDFRNGVFHRSSESPAITILEELKDDITVTEIEELINHGKTVNECMQTLIVNLRKPKDSVAEKNLKEDSFYVRMSRHGIVHYEEKNEDAALQTIQVLKTYENAPEKLEAKGYLIPEYVIEAAKDMRNARAHFLSPPDAGALKLFDKAGSLDLRHGDPLARLKRYGGIGTNMMYK